ncbi:GNAT family N-acetyltransferase [Hyunsoonleella flava]|uniref:GNAT family N-acetyltransferase n=1 Tax=Hyunsoonleella flava TaxID=2527939 RepID=A0A4V2JAC2_9FLAO|nr:GNAT family N-acetyltransferase [Hyunsoonleella flava]TBN05524.1 GNAT family N-acetyltransferase [Hyunsoonleella flava]
MNFSFDILDESDILKIVPLVEKLNDFKVSKAVLEERFLEMATQNYECTVIYDGDIIVGVCGLWYCTRHYTGKSVEVDHVYIEEAYRSKGLGKQFFKWIYDYVGKKGCKTVELNTYVSNYPSHKFYYNEGFEILGYHFLKKL